MWRQAARQALACPCSMRRAGWGSLPQLPLACAHTCRLAPACQPPRCCRALFYLAQHHDKLGNTAEALQLVDRCIEVGGSRISGLHCRLGGACIISSHVPVRCHALPAAGGRLGTRLERSYGSLTCCCFATPLAHLQHTPTLIEAYVAKAKFLKHAGERPLPSSICWQ